MDPWTTLLYANAILLSPCVCPSVANLSFVETEGRIKLVFGALSTGPRLSYTVL